MRSTDTGISIILADSAEEVTRLCNVLGVAKPVAFRSLEQMFAIDSDAVYQVILRSKQEMLNFCKFLNIKRGVLSANGHCEAVGFNVDWMRKLLIRKDGLRPDKSPVVAAGIIAAERDDPFLELGYGRR